jgi:uncharacterized metal-binding protein
MAKSMYPQCAHCPVKICENRGGKASDTSPSLQKTPAYCPMKLMPEVYDAAIKEYNKPAVKEFARLASVQEFQCYERLADGLKTRLPRIEETMQFARKCGYKRLGLAHCGGLAYEAGLLTQVLENNGFEVVSVQCKTGAVPKEKIGVKPEEKIAGADMWETMCNPIVQAMIINKSKVDLAIMLGLCVGHDTLFIKYCEVPLTVIAVKDRVLGHNPLAALYAGETYYKRLRNKID